MTKTILIRMRWQDLKEIQKVFPAERKEYAWHYFYRLRMFLDGDKLLMSKELKNRILNEKEKQN